MRAAMGAKPRDLLTLIMRESVRLTLSGAASGLLLTALLARIVARQVYGISPLDPATYVGVTLAVALVTIVACGIPTLRGLRVDPLIALRND